MKLTVHTFLTLDGVMQGPGAVDEDTTGGFDRGGWLVPYADQDMGEIVDSWFAKAEAILFGRNTYTMMHAYWTQVTDPDNVVAVALNGLPKFVASSTLHDPEWRGTTVLTGDAIKEVGRLKERPGGELQVHGSCELARSLHEAGLVDEYRLLVFPVCVGAGKRLFTGSAPATGFTLVASRTTSTGAVHSALTPIPFTVGGIEVVDGKDTFVRDVAAEETV
jgi:dihydrofolate reductase